jgi:head-tail adaptor
MPTEAGELTRKVTFQTRVADANGDKIGAWTAVVTRQAKIVPKVGGEAVQAQRLEGAQPVVIFVRCDSSTKTITAADRAVDARDATVKWGVVSVIWNEAEDMMEFLAIQRPGGQDDD